MSERSERNRKTIFSEWLEKLQQARAGILRFDYYLDENVVAPYMGFSAAFTVIIWSGWGIFLINLLAHIIIRGLWIGAIGLRYVSGDIDYDQLNYSDTFKRFFRRRIGSFDDYIERLERLSSVLFSFTFLLFFLFFSFVFANVFFGAAVLIIDSFFSPDTNGPTLFALIFGTTFYGLGLLVIIDFITAGGFKRVKDKTFSRIFLVLYRFYSLVSLSFLYRPLLLNFIDDKYTRKLFFLAIPYTLLLLVGLRGLSFERFSFIPSFLGDDRYFEYPDEYSVNWNNYDDLRLEYHQTYSEKEIPDEKSRIRIATLDKYEQDGRFAKLFIRYSRSDSELLERQHPEFSVFKKTGLRHNLFSKGMGKDILRDSIIDQQADEIRAALKVIRGETDKIKAEENSKFPTLINDYSAYSTEEIEEMRNKINHKYEIILKKHAEDKIKFAKKAILDNYQIRIDSVHIKDSLICAFYTHPNRHEQGLLCHIPMSNLSPGSHLIKIDKRYERDDCISDCPTAEKNIPFWIN